MRIDVEPLRVRPGRPISLGDRPTVIDPVCKSKKRCRKVLAKHVEQLSARQRLHYASARWALGVFQGMDAAGKDGAIRHVMSGVNPEGCEVFSFKQPSSEELKHDLLWRTTRRLPERGRIGIFNRSYYDEVAIVRVHPEILRGQGLPDELLDEQTIWSERYRSINGLERHLRRNGTRSSRRRATGSSAAQTSRSGATGSVISRRTRPAWATSTEDAPWYVVPADDKENARLLVSQIVLDGLKELEMAYPKTSEKRRRELRSIGKRL